MGEIVYRDATPADVGAIDALYRAVFAETFAHLYDPADLAAFFARYTREAWLEEMADPELAFHLAEQDGELAAFVKTGRISLPVRPEVPAAELRQLYIAAPCRGRGIADALMGWTLARARANGAEELYLSVFVDNHRARRFYTRYGFEVVGRYDFMVGTHADEDLIMRLKL
jgi:ribosomal protein S18 acetylase RimI-like enzyme